MGWPNPSSTRPSSRGPDRDPRVLAARHDRIAELQAVGLLERHGQHAAVAEADHLRADAAPGAGADFAEVADGRGRPARFDQQSDHLRDLPGPANGGTLSRAARYGSIEIASLMLPLRRRSARPRSISRSWVSTEASRLPRAVSKITAPGSRGGSGGDFHRAGRQALAQACRRSAAACAGCTRTRQIS